MTLYTRQGDQGDTHLPAGQPVRKSDAILRALGAVDELNSHLGLCIQSAQACGRQAIAAALAPVQRELLAAGALLAACRGDQPPQANLDESAVARMERQIDETWAKLPDLTRFVIPGGSQTACLLHVARTVCRRAERDLCAAADAGAALPPIVPKHVNRLGDLLFALARHANAEAGLGDTLWRPRDGP